MVCGEVTRFGTFVVIETEEVSALRKALHSYLHPVAKNVGLSEMWTTVIALCIVFCLCCGTACACLIARERRLAKRLRREGADIPLTTRKMAARAPHIADCTQHAYAEFRSTAADDAPSRRAIDVNFDGADDDDDELELMRGAKNDDASASLSSKAASLITTARKKAAARRSKKRRHSRSKHKGEKKD